MANEAERILHDFLARLQRNASLRNGLAMLLLLALIAVAGHFVYEILPRSHVLKITGGDLLSNRHFLAKSLQAELVPAGVSVQVIPINGSREALEQLDQGQLDLAFIQGGLDATFANVTHVATVAPELMHILVQPGIAEIADLRGKRVNLGSSKGGTRVIAKAVLEFSDLVEGIDYVETNLSSEELVSLPARKMPEAIVITSFAPSDVVDFLARERGYDLMEIPFPRSLALRLGWVSNSQITAYMYGVKPARPKRDIQTVGVNLHLVAHKDADPRAVFKVLEGLYSPAMEQRLRMKFEESRLTLPSGYPLSEGTKLYLDRNNPLLSTATLDRIKALFGLVLSVASTLLVVFRWFSGTPVQAAPVSDDSHFIDLVGRTMQLESQFETLLAGGAVTATALDPLGAQLSRIKSDALARLGSGRFDNPQLPVHLLHLISELRQRMEGHRRVP